MFSFLNQLNCAFFTVIFSRIKIIERKRLFSFTVQNCFKRLLFLFFICFYYFKSTISNAKNTKLICFNQKPQISRNFPQIVLCTKSPVSFALIGHFHIHIKRNETSLANLSLFSSKTICLFCLKVKSFSFFSYSSKLKAKKQVEDL